MKNLVFLLFPLFPLAACASFFQGSRTEPAVKVFPAVLPFEKAGWNLRALPAKNSATIASNVGGRSGDSIQFFLRPGEIAANGKRSELTDLYEPPLGRKITYRFSTFLPADYPSNDGNSTVIAQWHTRRPLKPPMAFRYRENRLDITLNHKGMDSADPEKSGQIRIARIPDFRRDRWHDFVLEVVWSPSEAGRMRIWVDGVQVADYRGPTTYFDESIGPYFKYGVYVSKPLKHPVTLFHGPFQRETSP